MKPVVKSVMEPISIPEVRETERSIVKYVQEKQIKEEIECEIRILQLKFQVNGLKEIQFIEVTVYKV